MDGSSGKTRFDFMWDVGMLRSSCEIFVHLINPQVLKEEVDFINKDRFQVKAKYENVFSLFVAFIQDFASFF